MKYGRSVIAGFSFDEAVDAAKTLLGEEGFGVLCDIDVGKTLTEKTGSCVSSLPHPRRVQPALRA